MSRRGSEFGHRIEDSEKRLAWKTGLTTSSIKDILRASGRREFFRVEFGDGPVSSQPYSKTPPAEIPPLPPGWKRVADHKERWEKMRLEAQALARDFARILVEKYGARRVWLYGSAAGVWVFHDGSDLDIVVEGASTSTLWDAEEEFQHRSMIRLDLRPRDWFTDETWSKMIPEPLLLAERKDETDPGS